MANRYHHEPGQREGAGSIEVRVVTVNVQNDEGDPRRIEALSRELRALEPDLVSLQEVLHTPGRDQLEELLDGTGLHGTHQDHAMAYRPPFADRYGGNAVATRWPHTVLEVLDPRLSGIDDVPWCTLATRVEIPDEGPVLFIAATAPWRLDAESGRELLAVALSDLDARHRTALPTIIAGDLNAAPDTASIRYLTGCQSLSGRSVHYHDAWALAGDGPGHTWTSDNPAARSVIDHIVRQPEHRRRLDYVLTGSWHAHPDTYCRVRAARLVFDRPDHGVWPSDHFGLVVDLDLGTG